MTHSLRKFDLGDMAVCTGAIRRIGNSSKSMQDVADGVVSYFYNNFIEDEKHDFALVRFFMTSPYGSLTPDLKRYAGRSFDPENSFPSMKCMVLQATMGAESNWCDPNASETHRVIPLPSEELIKQMPMIYQLITDFGLRVADVLEPPAEILLGSSEEDYNIFLVQDALGSPYIPAQENFVVPYKVKSALGFGGLLSSGNLFAVVFHSKVRVTRATADMFRCIALATNLALMRFDRQAEFAQ